METFDCPQNTQCLPPGTGTTDYLRMRMGHGQRYTQMYTTKELQTGEYWDASVSTGLERYDFDARFYDPQLGRWFVPDPAEQFHNPYLAMGNNPVVYVDPDGEFVHLIIGAAIGGMMNLIMNADNIENPGQFFAYFGVGALAGGLSAGVSSVMAGASFGAGFVGSQAAGVATSSFISGATIGASAGFSSGFVTGFGNTGIEGGNIGQMLGSGWEYGWKGAATGAALGGIGGGLKAVSDGKSFWTGETTFKDKVDYFISQHKDELIDEFGSDVFENTKIKGRRFFRNYGEARPTGELSGESFLGYEGEKSKLLISRRVINSYYQSHDVNSSATLFHEFFHANDYYSGFDNFMWNNSSPDFYINFLEFGAYQYENQLFNTPIGQHNIRYYIWNFLNGL